MLIIFHRCDEPLLESELLKRFRVRAVNLLLLGLIALGGFPLFEVRHSHAGGTLPHSHAGEDRQSHDHSHDHSAHHHHHDSSHEAHGHPHPHQGHHTEEQAQHHTQPAPVPHETSGQPDSDEWHLHGSWFGWLIGGDASVATSAGAVPQDQDQGPLVPGMSPVDEVVRSPQIRVSLIWMHGPPGWFRPIGGLCADQPIQLVSLQSASPPLCDMSRHERSGVLLI